jgi:hypothetical protein
MTDAPPDIAREIRLSQKMASKLAVYPKFMAWVFDRYKQIENVDDPAIQRLLGIEPVGYFHLAICGRPRSDLFAFDIDVLAERFNIQREPLIALIRRVDAITTFREYAEIEGQQVAAARDAAEDAESYDPDSVNSEKPPTEPDDEQ